MYQWPLNLILYLHSTIYKGHENIIGGTCGPCRALAGDKRQLTILVIEGKYLKSGY